MRLFKSLLFLFTLLSGLGIHAQENQIRRLPEINDDHHLPKHYNEYDKGFWCAAELSGTYSCRLLHSNFGYTELDATAGYRFGEYLRVGAGFGARYYFDNSKVRYNLSEWSFPLYVNIRGNIIPTLERSVVPYYSVDLGGTIQDGFLMRPTLGVRIGQKRSAMLLGLSYVGQHLTSFDFSSDGIREPKGRFVSFISLRVGYEF